MQGPCRLSRTALKACSAGVVPDSIILDFHRSVLLRVPGEGVVMIGRDPNRGLLGGSEGSEVGRGHCHSR